VAASVPAGASVITSVAAGASVAGGSVATGASVTAGGSVATSGAWVATPPLAQADRTKLSSKTITPIVYNDLRFIKSPPEYDASCLACFRNCNSPLTLDLCSPPFPLSPVTNLAKISKTAILLQNWTCGSFPTIKKSRCVALYDSVGHCQLFREKIATKGPKEDIFIKAQFVRFPV
jgi:hypothetical protein